MKTVISGILVLALATFASGCIGIMDRTDYKYPIRHLYQPTCECAECIAISFRERRYGEDGIAQAFCTVLLPVSLVDLPFEVVFDTVLVPLDLWSIHSSRRGNDSGKEDSEEVSPVK